jgi:hypothetical protein
MLPAEVEVTHFYGTFDDFWKTCTAARAAFRYLGSLETWKARHRTDMA